MIKLIIFFTLLFHHLTKCNSAVISASLYLVEYEPTIQFRLSFNQPISKPQFQMLLNNINLTYVFETQSNFTDIYLIRLLTDIDVLNPNVQSYSLVFNYPLNVANGQLNLADYILQPTKAPIFLQIPVWCGYILFTLIYLFSLFGIIGLNLIDFIQIFILTEYQFKHTTSIYQFIGDAFFTRIQADTLLDQSYIFNLCTPLITLFGIFVVCLIIKRILKNTESLYLLEVKQFFAYNLFLTAWSIFFMPIFYNACQYLTLSKENLLLLTSRQKSVCILITYLNFLSVIVYIYLMWFTINSKPCQNPQVYDEYLRSEDFRQYQKFYLGINFKMFHKRNYVIFITLRKLSVVFFYFRVTFLSEIILLQQILIMFYVFTVRPFKQQFYVNSSIFLNLLFFFCFLILVEGNLYFSMSDVISTQISINSYLLAKNIIFFLICLIFLVFSGIQNFNIFSNIRYKIKLFSEAKDDDTVDLTQSIAKKRLYSQSSNSNSIRKKMSKRNVSMIPQLDNISTVSTIFKKQYLARQTSQIHHSSSKTKLHLFEVQMQESRSPSIFRQRSRSSYNQKIKQQMKESKLTNQSDYKNQLDSRSLSPTNKNLGRDNSSKLILPNSTNNFSAQKKDNPQKNINIDNISNSINTKKQKQRWINKSLLQQLVVINTNPYNPKA